MIATTTTSVLEFKLTYVSSPDMPTLKIASRPYTWSEISQIVRTNDLEKFARSKELTAEYFELKRKLKANHSSVFKYLLVSQLDWYDQKENGGIDIADIAEEDIVVKAAGPSLFGNGDDLKVLPNHFPYYFEKNVTHLCIWTKMKIPNDPNSALGDISPAAGKVIDKYIRQTFQEQYDIPASDILWFRNWEALQSVKAMSHIHVIVRNLAPHQLEELLYSPGIPLEG